MRRRSDARARWTTAPMDGAVGHAEPRPDRVAARRGVRRGALKRWRGRPPHGAAAAVQSWLSV